MKKRSMIWICAVAVVVSLSARYLQSSPALSKYGSQGQEVRKIQERLRIWGYYGGSVDGIYGRQTERAVRAYQSNNGLTADGIAGDATLSKMGVTSVPLSSADAANENDVLLLARIINAEARGEPYAGQVAVGAVVLNRVKHPSFPNSISGVIFQPGAFTAITDGQWSEDMYSTPYRAAKEAMAGSDPSGGAIYYYNPAKTTNDWIYSRPVVTKIGNHIFAK